MTSYAIRDSTTMIRRNLRHVLRYPVMTVSVIAMPVIFLLLFVYVFGATMGAGIGGGGRGEYANYITPGILLMGVAGSAQGTAISVAMDMKEGIIARFRTMAIFRPAVLTGHVVSSLAQTMVGLAVVVAIALAAGFRPNATPVEWVAAVGLLAMITLALTWLSVAFGLVTRSVETASNLPLPLILLPFLGSGFVPTGSMPGPVRWFAEHQPFTAIMETLRGLLLGTGIGADAVIATGWCAAITVGGYVWSTYLYNRDPIR